jgi:hypothetical protein
MSNPVTGSQAASPLYRWERVIASLTVAWVMGLTTYMIFQEHALSHTSIYFLKIVLSLSGGVMLATLPGFFDINYTFGGLSVRAAGGAAAFIFIYTQSPALPALQGSNASPTGAHQYREQPKPDKTSMGADGVPVLMALSISPMSFMPSETYYQQQTVLHADSGDASGGGAGELTGGETFSTGGRVSIGEAVAADLYSMGNAVTRYWSMALKTAKHWLDKAASLLRTIVDRTAGLVRGLLSLTPADGGQPQTIGLFGQDTSEQLTDVTGALLAPEGGALVTLTDGLGDTLTAIGLSRTIEGLVATTDATVTGLVTNLQTTTGRLLVVTDTALGSVTNLLGESTGQLAGTLADPVEKLTSGLADTTDKIVGSVLPKAVTATSSVMDQVDAGFDHITTSLNDITPTIISKLDPDFIAGQHAASLEDTASLLRGPLLDDRIIPTVASLPPQVTGRLLDGGLLGGNRLLDGGAFNASESRCVSGCGIDIGGSVAGLRDSAGGLAGGLAGRNSGGLGLLGSAGQDGSSAGGGIGASAAGGLSGFGGGSSGPGGGGGLAGGAAQVTGAVGGTLKSLRRR